MFRIETSRLNKNRCVKLHFQDKNMVKALLIIKPFSIYYEQLPLPNIFSILATAFKAIFSKASALMNMVPVPFNMYSLFFSPLNTGRVCTIFREIILKENVSVFSTNFKPGLFKHLGQSYRDIHGEDLDNGARLLVRHLLSSLYFYLNLGLPRNNKLLTDKLVICLQFCNSASHLLLALIEHHQGCRV